MKFQQIIFALNRIIQVLISLEFTLLNIITKSLVTLQVLKFLIVQIKAYIQGFQMRYQSFLGHWYPNSYSWFSNFTYTANSKSNRTFAILWSKMAFF